MRSHLVVCTFICTCLLGVVSSAEGGEPKITFIAKQGAAPAAPKEPCEVQVFREAAPERPYEVLGTINYHDERHRSQSGSLTLDATLPRIKERACKAGADGLIEVRVTDVRRLESAMFNVSAKAVKLQAE